MKYLGIDYGTRRVGVAVSDDGGSIAFPRDVFPADDRILAALSELAKKERVERIVVGDTRSHGGGENPITAAAEKFMAALGKETGLTVSPAFEVFSSVEAARYAPEGSEHNDAAAAAVILQRFLDMQGKRYNVAHG